MSQNPYQSLEAKAFWSPAVAKRNMFDISDLWVAPFPITQSTKITTYGSCFAQHFSRALVARGFRWIDAEPAPRGLSNDSNKTFNYGVFSARTGNIYTTSLLKQWTEWALGHKSPPDLFWEKDGRYFDPFRPVIEPDGFGSLEELLASRAHTIAAFRASILDSNLFVFTLGLTESWWDRDTGVEYPMCPGTIAGEFDDQKHLFKNQDYSFVYQNLHDAIAMIRKAHENGPAFLLTVSPVPLTATNSGNNVLVASMESKSVLRAVAGQIARDMDDTSYFPSYEIINAAPYRATFFEPNLRSVNINGVNHVMKTFFQGLQELPIDTPPTGEPATGTDDAPRPSSTDLACEEELLSAFGPKK